MTSIENIIKSKGPLLSSDLILEIKNQEPDVSDEAVRKRISRTKSPISRVFGFYLDNQSLFYLEPDYRKEEYFVGLRDSFAKGAKRFDSIVSGMEFYEGFMNPEHLPAFSFSPVSNLKGHKNFTNIKSELERLEIIDMRDGYFRLHPFIGTGDFRKHKALETARNFVLTQFMSYARNIGLISYNTGTFYSEYAKFLWCFTSPSYIATLKKVVKEKIKPAFVVADVLIGKEAKENDVAFFIQKVEVLQNQQNPPTIIPFLLVDSVSIEALKLLKQHGVIVGFLNKLFGEEYSTMLKELVNTITNAGAILKKNPEAFLDLISKINKLVDGKTNNLRGDLFELAVGFCHARVCQSFDIGKIINHNGVQREVDVFAVYADQVRIAECKGYKSVTTKEEITEWLKDNVPIIRKWILAQRPYDNKSIVFEFWSTGGFEPEAIKILENASNDKYTVEYFDEPKIIAKAKEIKSKKFTDILRQYYLGEQL